MEIKLRVDSQTGEPFLECNYHSAGQVDDQVMVRMRELLKTHKLEVRGVGSDPRGGRWFHLRLDNYIEPTDSDD